MTTRDEPTTSHVALTVLPTGRAQALRHQMQDPTEPSPASVSTDPLSTRAAEAETSAADAVAQPPAPVGLPLTTIQKKLLEGRVIEALRTVYDPEIPVNIYELGLIYKIDVADDNSVHVQMTLTSPGCPVAGTLPGEVEKKVEAVPAVKSANVELVWEPTWSRDMMSEAAQLQLGFM
jgi:FeS assembly SUF system protein